MFEGDMILTDAQRMAAMLGEDVSKAGLGRASIRKNLWPGAVLVYQLDPAIGSNQSVLLNFFQSFHQRPKIIYKSSFFYSRQVFNLLSLDEIVLEAKWTIRLWP